MRDVTDDIDIYLDRVAWHVAGLLCLPLLLVAWLLTINAKGRD